ncbi:MAG: peptidoglycan DD-metalloendopeptidase family protein [Alistipes sp.]|nr:peptidoglycan DD-metalloendopeptidase family protein [Alistipes sp.]
MKQIYVAVLLILISVYAALGQKIPAAPALENLPKIAIDTLPTQDDDTKIIIYSNNTWSYYRPGFGDDLKDLPVYSENWVTEEVFAYRNIQISDLPQTIDVNLIASLDDFHIPITGKVFSKYGRRGRRNHNGVDIPLKIGEPIYATFSGRVRYSKYNTGGYGNLIILRHENGLETWYAHLSKSNVEPGEFVKAGQIIGYGGNTGRSRGPHLHFEVRYCDQTFDPEHLFDFEQGQIKYRTFALERSYFNINSRASDELEDHDFEEYASLVNSDGEEISSEDILNYIAQGGNGGSKSASLDEGDAVYHTIVSGDILGKLAQRYGVSIDQICRLNNIQRTTILQLGRRLRIK